MRTMVKEVNEACHEFPPKLAPIRDIPRISSALAYPKDVPYNPY